MAYPMCAEITKKERSIMKHVKNVVLLFIKLQIESAICLRNFWVTILVRCFINYIHIDQSSYILEEWRQMQIL